MAVPGLFMLTANETFENLTPRKTEIQIPVQQDYALWKRVDDILIPAEFISTQPTAMQTVISPSRNFIGYDI